MISVIFSEAHQLPAYRPERVEEVLWDWAENYDEQDIKKVMEELKHLFAEQFAEERRKQLASGNE